MRNVFLFLRRYAVFIFFLIMQGISLYMLFSQNRFHRSVMGMVASEWSGLVNERINRIEAFFTLRQQNENLRNQNAQLLSQLPSGRVVADTAFRLVYDTLKLDAATTYRQFQYLSAKVIANSVFQQQNYLMLHRGSDQGVVPNMAVVSPEGIIGSVVAVSKNMSTVMSLLHRQSKVIARLRKGGGLGEVTWDGKDPRYLTLMKVPKTVAVKKGDTVVPSPYSDKFPPDYPVGYVEKVEQDTETNTYILRIRTAADFYSVQHTYVVRNLLQEEMDQLKNKLNKE